MKIDGNTTVEIDFSITDSNGNIVESTKESGPVLYIHGREMMLQAVEDALLGKEAGKTSVLQYPLKKDSEQGMKILSRNFPERIFLSSEI